MQRVLFRRTLQTTRVVLKKRKIPSYHPTNASTSLLPSSLKWAAAAGVLGTAGYSLMPPEDFYTVAKSHQLPWQPTDTSSLAVEEPLVQSVSFTSAFDASISAPPQATPQIASVSEHPTEPTKPKTPTSEEPVPVKEEAPKQEPTEIVVSAPKDDMIKARYVLVGGGAASYSAAQTILEREPQADVLIITQEQHVPYMRPPLSKELWFAEQPSSLSFKDWGGTQRSLFFDPEEKYVNETGPVEEEGQPKKPRILTGKKATGLDVEAHVLTLDDGTRVKYNKVLLATGGTPKTLPLVNDLDESAREHVSTFRTIEDLKHLEQVVKSGDKRILVVGGGFLGSELACALSKYGSKFNTAVTQVFPESGNMGQILPKYLTLWTTDKVRELGVDVRPDTSIASIHSTSGSESDKPLRVSLSTGEAVDADHIILAIGITPNIELAREANLEIDPVRNGIVVNAELEARTNVYAAGDVVSFYDTALGRRRIEHHDHAILSGRIAGKNMTGGHKAYKHQSMFWSDLGPEVGYEGVGILDSALPTVGIWAKKSERHTPKADVESGESIRSGEANKISDSSESPSSPSSTSSKDDSIEQAASQHAASNPEEPEREQYGRGVVFYTKNDRIVGVLLWNLFNRTQIARRLISEGRHMGDQIHELAQLFQIHEEDS